MEEEGRSGQDVLWAERMALACLWLWKWRNEEVFNNRTWKIDQKLRHLEAAMVESELLCGKINTSEIDREIRVACNG